MHEIKRVWQVSPFGYLSEKVELSEIKGDYKEGQWLIPAGCVEVEPLEEKEGFERYFNGESWEYQEIFISDSNKDFLTETESSKELMDSLENNKSQSLLNQVLGWFKSE